MPRCPACASSGGGSFTCREMMYGTREEFRYIACPGCGCLYIETIPTDIARHYPPDYYSLGAPSDHRLVQAAKRLRGQHALGRKNWRGAAVTLVMGPPDYVGWTRTAGVGTGGRILDVGAGGGHRVFNMAAAGFEHVAGVEPYLDKPAIILGDGAIVHRELPAGEQPYDLLMMHHSFEHMPEPLEQLRSASALLRPGGVLLLRVPVAGSYAWRTYGENWVQLDPPRHLVLHTEASIATLAASAGLVVKSSSYDSTALQFWGSEMYAADVPLVNRHSWLKANGYRRGSRKLLALDRRARRLNERRDGDQAAFFLERP